MINSIQIGRTRCMLSQIDKNTLIAHNNKTWRLGVNEKGNITIFPLATHSFSFIAPLSSNHFLGCVGKTLRIIADNPTSDLSFTRVDSNEPIVNILSIIDTSVLFVATNKVIKLIDLTGVSEKLGKNDAKAYCEEDEFIVDMSISDVFTVSVNQTTTSSAIPPKPPMPPPPPPPPHGQSPFGPW